MRSQHANHFDALRLLFALFVLTTHAWSLTGRPEHDPIFLLTDGQTTLSYLGVRGFFAISGFLVLKSFLRTSSASLFVWKRALRIMPALVVNVLLTGMVLGPLVTELSIPEYFGHPGTWAFLENPFRMLLGGSVHGLPGAFPLNPRTPTVNGALWTIPYELLCYMAVLVLYIVRRRDRLFSVILMVSTLLVILLRLLQDMGRYSTNGTIPYTAWEHALVVEILPYFLVGAVVARADLVPRSPWLLLGLFLGLLLGYLMHRPYLLDAVLWPLIVIGVGYLPGRPLLDRQRTGDISYGTYLYGYPVQQMIVMLCGLSLFWQFLLAIPLTLILGRLSWRWVERPALRTVRRDTSL